jgi:hypothetical protein
MIAVMKSDLERIIHNNTSTAHYWTIFTEIEEVYDPDIQMTLDDMLRPFLRKKFNLKVPGKLNRSEVRYADYIIPLFYTAYLCKSERSCNVVKELLGLILKDNGHFYWNNPKSEREYVEEWGREFWRDYWGSPKLTSEESERVNTLYATYEELCTSQ